MTASSADLFAQPGSKARTARIVAAADLDAVLDALPETAGAHARASGFEAAPSQVVILPGAEVDALIGAGPAGSAFDIAGAAMALPEGDWALEATPFDPTETAIAFALGGYQFTRYKQARRKPARLVAPEGCDTVEASRIAAGAMLTRDLVNTPAGDMLPSRLQKVAEGLAEAHGATCSAIIGEDLLEQNYPMIHAVGRASDDAPRLIEIEWGDPAHPRLALVGKGVC
ncbi:MAG: leucyl aminopeptidase family protein, partial [Oceanicaulis sp.]